jgi:o-succinylbenzoate synthase
MNVSIRRFSGNSSGAQNAHLPWASRSGLLLELRVGSVRGVGEASPLPGYSTDTLLSAEQALAMLDVQALEQALEIVDTKEALKTLAALLPGTESAARMALETAALDLRGQQLQLSAPALLGADPGAERQLAWLVGAADAQALETIRRAQCAGYAHFKIKTGYLDSFTHEITSLRALRHALGAAPRLRLDANQGWCRAEVASAIRQLEALDIEFIEEPSAGITPECGARIPVALDESLRGVEPERLEELAARSAARFVVLKPMVLGGLSRCLEWARYAMALNLGVVISHSFDGPVALIAAATLALALPTSIAQGLAPHAGLAAWPKIPLPISNASLRAWNTPGLGLAVGLFA